MPEPTPLIAVLVATGGATEPHAGAAAIAAQTHAPDAVIAPTGTDGAARLREGIRLAHERGAARIWIVRDDTVPDPSALAALVAAAEAVPAELAPAALLAAKPLSGDGTVDEARTPRPDYKRVERAVAGYEQGLQPIRWAELVCALLDRSAVEAHGLPSAGYTLDDSELEYTARILRDGVGFLVPRGVVRIGPADGVAAAGLASRLGDTVRMLRSGSFACGESVGLGIGRAVRALRRG